MGFGFKRVSIGSEAVEEVFWGSSDYKGSLAVVYLWGVIQDDWFLGTKVGARCGLHQLQELEVLPQVTNSGVRSDFQMASWGLA